MGNTPSNQSGQGPSGTPTSPTRRGPTNNQPLRSATIQGNRPQSSTHRHAGTRQSQSQRPESGDHSNPSSPLPNRPGSPRRRKSLELPDLNTKLTFTNAQDVNVLTRQLETLEPTSTGSTRVKSPLGSTTPYDEESSLGNTPPRVNPNSKRISLTSGTRARSPPSTASNPMSPLGDQIRRGGSDNASVSSLGASQGVPIPGAKPVRRSYLGADEPENPYFPPVAKQRGPPTTPGLPNYGHSPHAGNSESGPALAHVEHAEQAEYHFSSRDKLLVNTNIPPTGPRQPSPARPAPAVVTTDHHHDIDPQEVLVSALPQETTGSVARDHDQSFAPGVETPLASEYPSRREDPDQTPLGLPSLPAQATKPQEDEEQTAVPTLVTWSEGGKNVYVTGTFAPNGWKARLKMNKR
jgi:hypothetical protein